MTEESYFVPAEKADLEDLELVIGSLSVEKPELILSAFSAGIK